MKTTFHRSVTGISVLFLILLTTLSCSSATDYSIDDSIEKITMKDLMSSPQELSINNLDLEVTTFLWRDFMPSSPPDGKPLVASVTIESNDGESLPENLNTDAIWVIHGDEVWGTGYSDELFEDDLTKISKTARDGPKFGPDVSVTVVIRVLHGETPYMLRKTGQEIVKTM